MLQLLDRIILIGKAGNGITCSKISLPYLKLKELGFNQKEKDAIIAFTEDSIIIKKKPKNLLKLIDNNKLENGILLVDRDYDRQRNIYINGINEKTLISTNKQYKPFYINEELLGYEEI